MARLKGIEATGKAVQECLCPPQAANIVLLLISGGGCGDDAVLSSEAFKAAEAQNLKAECGIFSTASSLPPYFFILEIRLGDRQEIVLQRWRPVTPFIPPT